MDQDQVATEGIPTSVREEVPVQEQAVAETAVESAPIPIQEETQDQINHRALRELKEKAEKDRDDARRQLEAYKNQQPQQQQKQPEEIVNYNVAPDDWVEGKHLNAVDKKIKQLEQQVHAYQQQNTAQTIEAKLKSQYPDFDQVVSKENIEILSTAYPELANAIGASTDLYSKASSTYTLIKKFGIGGSKANAANIDRVKQNLAKPVPTASLGTQTGESPLTKANAFADGLTPELKKQLLREMIEAEKNR